jgi:lysophospholipase L1-like esterase
MRTLFLLLLAFFAVNAGASSAVERADMPGAVSLTAPSIKEGLAVRISGRKIIISPGSIWINDKLVTVEQEVVVPVPACPPVSVRNEVVQLKGDLLSGLVQWRNSLKGSSELVGDKLVAASVKVKSRPDDSSAYQPKVDFIFEGSMGMIGRTAGGAIKDGQKVFVDYVTTTRRLDTLIIDPAGKIKLVRETPEQLVSASPEAQPGELALANILAEPGNDALRPADFLPIKSKELALLPLALRKRNEQALARTVQKMRDGQLVTIVFWGDSITSGADSSSPEHSFANQVVAGLRKKYPKARLRVGNAGIGGSSTTTRLPNYTRDVLSAKPDLIFIEFINDVHLKKEEIEANYKVILARAREAGADVLQVNPSLPTPSLLHVADWKAVSKNFLYDLIRNVSASNGTALADVAARWEHLDKEGLTPELLLSDKIVHPNDAGHLTYAQEILKCF